MHCEQFRTREAESKQIGRGHSQSEFKARLQLYSKRPMACQPLLKGRGLTQRVVVVSEQQNPEGLLSVEKGREKRQR